MDIFLASTKLTFKTTEKVKFELNTSNLFRNQIVDYNTHLNCFYRTINKIELPQKTVAFEGHSFEDTKIPYEWKIFKNDCELIIHILYYEDFVILETLATINFFEKTISVDIHPRSSAPIIIDPLFHPLGSLLMIYLSHFSSGFMIHAAGINDNDNGYLFTGVSGIGKSTMSGLWKNQGAKVINDDRLWVQKIDNEWKMFNTPMINYIQEPLMANLSKIFLLSQSPDNFINEIPKTQGALQVMANCIQHLFDKEITTTHLDSIFDMTNHTLIYELGFKPTSEIVSLIRKM